MVREFYPDATIANIEDSGTGSCYAQFGADPTYKSDSIFKICMIGSMQPGSDLDTHGCKGSAGFTWCDRTQSCLRDFETPCSSAPVKDVLCANAGTDREAYCTYSLGPALYPEEFPVDLHFCAYCADDN